jgi:hypothetical protein
VLYLSFRGFETMANPAPAHAAANESAPATLPTIGAHEVWALVGPWLGHVFLTAAAVLGLFTASGEHGVTYGAGLATFVVAVLLIFLRIKRQLDGREIGFLLPIASMNIDSLVVTIAVLAILGLVGIVLAATVGGELYGIGLALFIITVAIIFSNIKRYFDLRERGG